MENVIFIIIGIVISFAIFVPLFKGMERKTSAQTAAINLEVKRVENACKAELEATEAKAKAEIEKVKVETEKVRAELSERIRKLEEGVVPDFEQAKEATKAVNDFAAGITGILGFDPYSVIKASREAGDKE